MDKPTLSLSDFPVQAPIERKDGWFVQLYVALRDALEIEPRFEPEPSGGARGSNPPWAGVEGELTGGIRAVGVKKRSQADAILVDFALFGPGGDLLAWTPEPQELYFFAGQSPNRRYLQGLGADLKARIKAMAKPKTPAKASVKAKGKTKEPFEAEAELRSVAISADGTTVAATDVKNNLVVWDGATGATRGAIKVGGAGLKFASSLAFSPDGRELVAGASKLRIVDVASMTSTRQLAGHPKGEVQGLAWSPCGRFIASSSSGVRGYDRSIALWDAATGEQLHRWPLPLTADAVAQGGDVAFASDGSSLLFATTHPGSIQRIDLATRSIVASWEFGGYAASSLCRIEDGWVVVGVDGQIVVCDPETLVPTRRLASPLLHGRVRVLSTHGGRQLVVSSHGGVQLIDAQTGEVTRELLPSGAPAPVAVDATSVVTARAAKVTRWPL